MMHIQLLSLTTKNNDSKKQPIPDSAPRHSRKYYNSVKSQISGNPLHEKKETTLLADAQTM
jgi:hypothetical protein